MRTAILLAVLCCVGFPAARAADPEPTLELRIQSLKDLLPLAPYLGGLADKAEEAEQGAKFIEALAGKKGIIEGFDISKPIGAYASMTPAVIDSPILVMVPVGDEKAFLNLLRGKLNLAPEKGDDDVYSLDVPNVPPKVYFKFHAGYAYITVHNKQALAAKSLISPETFFAKKESSIVSFAMNLDRIPADVRKTILGQMELKLNDGKAQPAKTPAEGKVRDFTLDLLFGGVTALLQDGKTAKLDLAVEPKTDDIGLAFSLTAKDGTELKSLLAESAKRTGIPQLVAAKNSILTSSVNVKVPESLKSQLGTVVDALIQEAVEKAAEKDREIAKKALAVLAPTLKAGILQMGVSLHAAEKPGQYEYLSAMRVAEGTGIEKFLKEIAPALPANIPVRFGVEKLRTATLHEMTPPKEPRYEAQFGNGKLWMTTDDQLLTMGLAEKADAVKALANGTPGVSPVLMFEASVSKLLEINIKPNDSEKLKAVLAKVFPDGKVAGNDTVKLTATTGEKLDIRLTVKGKFLQMSTLLRNNEQ